MVGRALIEGRPTDKTSCSLISMLFAWVGLPCGVIAELLRCVPSFGSIVGVPVGCSQASGVVSLSVNINIIERVGS